MAVKEVLKMGNPTLRVKSEPVDPSEISTPEFKQLIQDMFETMDAEDGIGIAAPQIGVNKQVAIIGVPKENPRYQDLEDADQNDEDDEAEGFEIVVVINPKITVTDPTLRGFWEGCLSVPGLRGFVERPSGVRVDFLDLEGKAQTIETTSFAATVFQHEIDHLEGILYVDRVEDKSKLSFIDEFMKYHDQ
ncbi:MAG: peptide deformylase [Halobacteriovoraceae bacterium]|nr:peptide deformylase [Halobacteriovoraceae bacterium]|tara:strand:+ start:234733 stop:235302 length:570 start_codon:yes stop_codon:yes gene_type:complete